MGSILDKIRLGAGALNPFGRRQGGTSFRQGGTPIQNTKELLSSAMDFMSYVDDPAQPIGQVVATPKAIQKSKITNYFTTDYLGLDVEASVKEYMWVHVRIEEEHSSVPMTKALIEVMARAADVAFDTNPEFKTDISDNQITQLYPRFLLAIGTDGPASSTAPPKVGDFVKVQYQDSLKTQGEFIEVVQRIEMLSDLPGGEGSSPSAQDAFNNLDSPIQSIGPDGTPGDPAQAAAQNVCPEDMDTINDLKGLADAIGIELPILLAVRRTESNGNPTAIRFEPHRMVKYDNGIYKGQIPYARGSRRDASGQPVSDSSAGVVDWHPEHTGIEAFRHAFSVDPASAIKSTSWGLYQVMGDMAPLAEDDVIKAALSNEDNAIDFVTNFYETPVKYSDNLLAAWFKNNPEARTAANNRNFFAFAKIYNGNQCCGPGTHRYDEKIASYYNLALACPDLAEAEAPTGNVLDEDLYG